MVRLHLLLLLAQQMQAAAAARYDDLLHSRHSRHHDERGSVTMEHVLWAVAVIAIAGIVIVAVTNYVTNQSAKIK